MIGEAIVWPGFTSTSTDVDYVIETVAGSPDAILFEVELHPGDIAAMIQDYSEYRQESEVLIAACSAFVVVATDSIHVPNANPAALTGFTIPKVRLNYFSSWFDFDIDSIPPALMV
jgi:hypothetical protein